MNYVQFVTVLNGRHRLSEDVSCTILFDAIRMFHYEVVKVATITQLLYEVQFRLCIDDFVQSNDARVCDKLHTSNFLIEVCSRDLVKLVLVNDFDGYSKTREDVLCTLDHGEMARPEGVLHVIQSSYLARHL